MRKFCLSNRNLLLLLYGAHFIPYNDGDVCVAAAPAAPPPSAFCYCTCHRCGWSNSHGSRGGGALAADAAAAAEAANKNIGNFMDETLFCPKLPDALLQRDKELTVKVAVHAVVKAFHVAYALQPSNKDHNNNNHGGISTITKTDLSPVTVADYAVQAMVLQQLHDQFPHDDFVAEEDATELQKDETLANQVMQATRMPSLDNLCNAIHLGQPQGKTRDKNAADHGTNGAKLRVWCLDPIDGTRGFLRGKEQDGQFCVALALLEDGIPVLGILGCPNLSWTDGINNSNDNDDDDDATAITGSTTKGCLFVAVKGAGCYQLPLVADQMDLAPRKLAVTLSDGSSRTLQQARMCMGVETYSDARGLTTRMAQWIHHQGGDNYDLMTNEDIPLLTRRVDSQVKYGLVARGDGEFYVRLPKIGYQEWIWDHAAGAVVLEEAGGVMTDTEGNPIDFSLGRKLSPSIKGILGSNGGIFHQALLDAYHRAEHELLERQKVS